MADGGDEDPFQLPAPLVPLATVVPARCPGPSARADCHQKRIFDLRFRQGNEATLASCGEDETARVWTCDTSGGSDQPAWTLAALAKGHEDPVLRVAWSEDGAVLATASGDTTIRLWDVSLPALETRGQHDAAPDLRCNAVLADHPEEVYACDFVPGAGGSRIVSASGDEAFLWDAEGCAILARDKGVRDGQTSGDQMPDRWRPGYLFCLAPDARGELVAASCSDGVVRAWGGAARGTLEHVAQVDAHSGMGVSCCFLPDTSQLISAGSDGTVCLIDTRTWRTVDCIQMPAPLGQLAACPGCRGWAVGAGRDGNVWVLDVSTAQTCPIGSVTDANGDVLPQRALLSVAVSDGCGHIAAAGEPLDVAGEDACAHAEGHQHHNHACAHGHDDHGHEHHECDHGHHEGAALSPIDIFSAQTTCSVDH